MLPVQCRVPLVQTIAVQESEMQFFTRHQLEPNGGKYTSEYTKSKHLPMAKADCRLWPQDISDNYSRPYYLHLLRIYRKLVRVFGFIGVVSRLMGLSHSALLWKYCSLNCIN